MRFFLTSMAMLIFATAFTQEYKQVFLGAGVQAGFPVVRPKFKEIWTMGIGASGKFGIPIRRNNYFIGTVSIMSFTLKSGYATITTVPINENEPPTAKYKERNILNILAGFRHDFANGYFNYFYMEPQAGIMQVGKDYSAFVYVPSAGFSIKGKVDIGCWFMNTVSNVLSSQISAAGISVTYNIYPGRKKIHW